MLSQAQRKRLSESRLEAVRRKGRRIACMEGQLPVLLHASEVEVPATPAALDLTQVPNVDVLKFLHPHPRDSRVHFRAEDHVYFVDDKRTNGSVTSMIHSFCAGFDEAKVIDAMMSGPRWPRAGYLKQNPSIFSFARVAMACPELVELYAASPRDEAQISQALRRIYGLTDHISMLCLSAEEIRLQWQAHGAEASLYGTWMHFLFEAHLNGHKVPTASPEFRLLRYFLQCEPKCTAWRTEWTIFAEEENLAGSIDFCARLPDGTFLLADWKRSAELRQKFSSSMKMRRPLQHLDDCAGMQYRLQLNAYRYILEKYYDLSVSRMLIVCCHPDNGSKPFVDEVPRMEAATEAMMQTRRDQAGGALPVEVLQALPTFFFSWFYLKNLASVSTQMKAVVCDCKQWRELDLSINIPEFDDQSRLRQVFRILEHCRSLCINMPQMAMLGQIPSQAKLVWEVAPVPIGRTPFRGVESLQPLMGMAFFKLQISSIVRGLYIGVKEPGRAARSYVRVDNLRAEQQTWSFGYNSFDLRPHVAAARVKSDVPNTFHLRWNQRFFSVELNGVSAASMRCQQHAPDMAAPLARLYVWAYCSQGGGTNQDLQLQPLPSNILFNAHIKCALCNETHSLLFPRWSVCPACCTWVCAQHVGENPWRSCSTCRLNLSDYVGGASVRTQEHRARVVGGTFRQNAYFFETYPVALHLLPDPRNAAYRSKRQWEKAMFQTRNLIAMLRDDYPHKMTLLYMYVHTLLRRNSATQALFVARIEHPLSAEQTYEDWMRSLIAFLVQQVFPIGRHGRQDMTEYFGPDVRGGAVSQDTFMPGHGMNHEEEAATQESFPFLDRDREDMMEASPELRIEQELDMILQKKNDEDQARQALLSKARTRRTIPGAESTFSKFKSDFEKLRIQANMNLQGAMPRPSSSEPSIPEYVDRIRVSVQTRFPDIDEKLLRVVTGALAAYRLRLTDLHVRELVMFLWIVEGDVHMRCHDGNIFFFRDGAFRLHRGVPPQSTLARCKKIFLASGRHFQANGICATCDGRECPGGGRQALEGKQWP